MNPRARYFLLPAATMVAVGAAWGASPSNSARSDYIEFCGGCHGIGGKSAPARVPQLQGRAGYFLCTPEGREYLVRLPNVARAPVQDDEALADLVNFVTFDLGGSSAPAGARRFDAAEVGALRQREYSRKSLVALRKTIVSEVIRDCPRTPATFRTAF
ncbi:MAG: cytochrome C [Sphingomonadaceae bacterium]|nr:cytochrome C [Altererythrobacter sp.]MCP5392916.1 cytochrome C [Sphingomonadaceae bacterium]